MKKKTLLLLILLVWLQYSLWLGKNGVCDLMYIKNNIKTQQLINIKLRERNDKLIIKINDLNKNKEAIEERSRNELTMIKSGETFYRLVPK